METTQFFKTLEQYRRKDPTSPTGVESDKVFCTRLGLANKSITLYRRGAIPTIAVIKRIAQKGGLTNDQTHELYDAASGNTTAITPSHSEIPIYRADEVTIEGPIADAPLFNFVPPVQLNKYVPRATLSGIMLGEDDCSAEPRIQRGSLVIYSNSACDPENFKYYVMDTKNGASVRQVRLRGRQMWISGENLDDVKNIPLSEFQDKCMGKVIMASIFQVPMPSDY